MMALNGIDISSWQADINLSTVPADFVIIKATGGTGYINPVCAPMYQAAKKAGKKVGIYHYAHEEGSQGSAEQEARHFLENTRGYWGEAVLALDWEGDNVSDTLWAKAWLDTVAAEAGAKPLIYMNSFAEASYNWSAVAKADYGLWLANYPSSKPQSYGPVSGQPGLQYWPRAAIWQYTQWGRLSGYAGDLDLNIFYGDLNAWDAYARSSLASAPQSSAAVQEPQPSLTQGMFNYTVQAGDSLSAIGEKFGVNYQEIAVENGIPNPNVIYIGQVLRIPTRTQQKYIIQLGDTLSGIAAQYGTSYQAIAAKNGIQDPNVIYAGQELVIS